MMPSIGDSEMTIKHPLKQILPFVVLSLLLVFGNTLAGTESELISLSENVQYIDAIKIFNNYSQQYDNKVLLDMSDYSGPIGVNIDKIHWKAALHSILKKNHLLLSEKENAILINKEAEVKSGDEVKYIDDILIEVTFFEADFNTIRELGIDWSSFVNGQVSLNANTRSTDQLTQQLFGLGFNRSFAAGSTTIDVTTLFNALASTDKGHIISRPQITVMSGETGTVQDGMDYTVLVPGRTSTGEEIDQAHEVNVQSGTIVHVTPTVILDEEGEKAVRLVVKVERSTAQPDATGYSKKTSEVNSQKILYNSEETIVGGLTTKETISLRKGIPFLKDLPWWVFGIRYLVGYSQTQVHNKELIILIKATILPGAHERKKIRVDSADQIEQVRDKFPEIEKKFKKK
jgi:type IV pilus assembly protein PilQ